MPRLNMSLGIFVGRMDTDVDDPEQLAEDLYSGKLAAKQ